MKRIAIIGGGISGLSAAVTLERARGAGAPIEYRLYEAGPRLGGQAPIGTVERPGPVPAGSAGLGRRAIGGSGGSSPLDRGGLAPLGA